MISNFPALVRERKREILRKALYIAPDRLVKRSDVSADLRGSQFSRFRCEPESLPVVAEHTNASAAVGNKQSRL